MKTSLLFKTAGIALVVGTSAALFSGCAATSTRESTGEYIDNSAITAKVKSALAADEVVKARDITVESYKGRVQLSGFVNTPIEKARADIIAKGVEGVTSVENRISVK